VVLQRTFNTLASDEARTYTERSTHSPRAKQDYRIQTFDAANAAAYKAYATSHMAAHFLIDGLLHNYRNAWHTPELRRTCFLHNPQKPKRIAQPAPFPCLSLIFPPFCILQCSFCGNITCMEKYFCKNYFQTFGGFKKRIYICTGTTVGDFKKHSLPL